MRIFPTLIIPALAYYYCAYMDASFLIDALFNLELPSGTVLVLTGEEAIGAGGLILLCVEMIKSASCSKVTALDHGLSLLVFVGCLVGIITQPGLGTPTFLLLTLMTLVDVIAGFAISLSSARRDLTFG